MVRNYIETELKRRRNYGVLNQQMKKLILQIIYLGRTTSVSHQTSSLLRAGVNRQCFKCNLLLVRVFKHCPLWKCRLIRNRTCGSFGGGDEGRRWRLKTRDGNAQLIVFQNEFRWRRQRKRREGSGVERFVIATSASKCFDKLIEPIFDLTVKHPNA